MTWSDLYFDRSILAADLRCQTRKQGRDCLVSAGSDLSQGEADGLVKRGIPDVF